MSDPTASPSAGHSVSTPSDLVNRASGPLPAPAGARLLAPSAAPRIRHQFSITSLAFVAVLVGGMLRLHWALSVPFNDAPDEYCHYPMVAYLAEYGRFPTMADVPERIPVSYPALPALGYLPCALTLRASLWSYPGAHVSARLGNVVVGILTLLVAYAAARRLVPGRPGVAVATVWAMALHPQLAFINAYANNDSAMILACTVLWYLWIRHLDDPRAAGPILSLGVVAGLALLCKMNAAGVILAGTPVVAWNLWRSRERRRLSTLYALAGLLAAVVLAPWVIWSWTHHHSLHGADVHRRWWFEHLAAVGIDTVFLEPSNSYRFIANTWLSFWASFGYCNTWVDGWVYAMIFAVVAMGMTGLVVEVVRWRRTTDADRWRPAASTALLAGGVTLVAALHAFHSANFGLAAQGRYLMPAVWPMMACLTLGSAALVVGARRIPVGIVVLLGTLAVTHYESLREERKSNRFRQEDRRVRTRMLSYVAGLPGSSGSCPPGLQPDGPIELDYEDGTYRVRTTSASDALVANPTVPTEKLAWLVVEQEHRSGALDGTVAIRTEGIDAGRSVPISFRRVGNGAYRYVFDLRGLAKRHREAAAQIVFHAGAGPCEILLRRFELFDVEMRPVIFSKADYTRLNESIETPTEGDHTAQAEGSRIGARGRERRIGARTAQLAR